jgi:predicted transcriptional regulator
MTVMQSDETPRMRKKKQAKPAGSNQHLQKLHGNIAQMDAAVEEIKKFIQQVQSRQTHDGTIVKKSVRDLNRHFENSLREMHLYQEALDAEKRRQMSELLSLLHGDLDVEAALNLAREGNTDKAAIVRALCPAEDSAS